jgi:PAS domain S-box-containing protein
MFRSIRRLSRKNTATGWLIPALFSGSSNLALWAFGLTVVAGISAMFIVEARVRYASTISDAESSAQSYADILAEHTARTFEAVERTLTAAQSIRNDLGPGQPATKKAIKLALQNLDRSSPALLAVGWTNETGDVIADSYDGSPVRPNISDLDHFKAQRDGIADELYIAPLFRSKATGKWISSVSMRLNNPDGSFAGIVAGTLDFSYFARIYRMVQLGPNTSVSLMRADGTVLTREPFLESAVRQSYAQTSLYDSRLKQSDFGVFESKSPLDGKARIIAYKTVPGLPLIMLVAADREELLAQWNRRVRISAIPISLLIAMVIFGTFTLSRRSGQLLEKTRLLEATLDNMHQGMIVVDKTDRIAICNRKAMRLLDLPEELMASRPLSKDVIAYQTQQGEFTDTTEKIKARLQPRLFGESYHVYERERTNGTILQVRTVPFQDGGVIRTYTDITSRKLLERELKDREERYRLLADNSTDMIFRLDFNFVRQYVSPACQEILGYSPEEMVGQTPLNMIHPDDADRVGMTYKAVADGLERTSVTNRIRHRDGRWIWVEAELRLVRDSENHRPVGILGALRNVSARKMLEAEAAAATQQAENAAKAQAQFLATMSHELRTPLNSIVGFADIVLDRLDLNPEVRRQIGLIQTASDSLLTVVNDILDFSKIEEGKMELTSVDFDFAKLIEDSVSIVRAAAVAKQLDLRISIDESISRFLVGDEHRLRQVLLNLLNNAIKFTRKGHIFLAVHRLDETESANTLRFDVSDTGIGISQDKFGILFQRFSQVDGTSGREFGGSGLGLVISKRLVEAMGGQIAVTSVLGNGSTFWFTLALPVGQNPAADASSQSQPSAVVTPARLLLVEDVDINREIAISTLEHLGYTVDAATDGFYAVSYLEAKEYDLVLMDIQMPLMDGITATRRIRALSEPKGSIPIIAMTANVLPTQVEAFREAGMNGHVGKPFKRNELIAVIERCLRRSIASETLSTNLAETARPTDSKALETLTSLLGHAKIEELLGKLSQQLQEFIQRLSTNSDGSIDLGREAHNLVSSAGMLGFASVSDQCARLEIRLSSDQDVSALLEEARATCVTALAKISASLKAASDVTTGIASIAQ